MNRISVTILLLALVALASAAQQTSSSSSSKQTNRPSTIQSATNFITSLIQTASRNPLQSVSSSSSTSAVQVPPLPMQLPSFQSLLDVTGLHRLTDPVVTATRKRWQRLRQNEFMKRVLGQMLAQRRKYFH